MCVYVCVLTKLDSRINCLNFRIEVIEPFGSSSQYKQELQKQEKIYRPFTSPTPVFRALIFQTFIFLTSRQATWYENVEEYSPSARDLFHR